MSDKKFWNSNGKLVSWPSNEKERLLILTRLIKIFSLSKEYNEKEVNSMLAEIIEVRDFAFFRRELVDRGFLGRANDCSKYFVLPPSYLTENLSLDNITICDLKHDDIPIMMPIYDELFNYLKDYTHDEYYPNYFEECLRGENLPPDGLLEHFRIKKIVRDTNEHIGFLAYYHGYPTKDTIYISIIAIANKYRDSGLGVKILNGISEDATFKKYRFMRLGVDLLNVPGMKFWHKCGFDTINKVICTKPYSDPRSVKLALTKTL